MYGNPYNPYLTNQMNGMFPQNNPGFTPPTPQNFQNPVPNDNANYRALHDEFVQFQMQNKDAQIAALTTQVNNLNLKASQEAQSAYLVDTIVGRIHPPAVPSWNVPNPYAVYYNHNPQCHPCGQYN